MEIIYLDNHFIAVNKKAGELVQPDKNNTISLEDSLKEYLKKKFQKRGNVFLGVVHRIDRPVTGVVLFARTSKGLSRINNLFQLHQVKKTYLAIVKNKPNPEENYLIHYLVRNEAKNKTIAYDTEVSNSKKAILHYKLIGKSDMYYLLEIDLQTGRHHQIRAQLSKIGCPIKGDLKYGYPRSNKDESICLHSYKIEFVHPINNMLTNIIAPLPIDNLWKYFAKKYNLNMHNIAE